jgi:hypothetical protein
MCLQAASNLPYAHWTWYQPTARAYPAYDCVVAVKAYSYEQYTGGGALQEQKSAANYQARRCAWSLAATLRHAASIWALHATSSRIRFQAASDERIRL